MAANEFLGHAPDSSSKLIYTNPTGVAPADQVYGADTDSDGKPNVFDRKASKWANTPGAAARSNGYPRA